MFRQRLAVSRTLVSAQSRCHFDKQGSSNGMLQACAETQMRMARLLPSIALHRCRGLCFDWLADGGQGVKRFACSGFKFRFVPETDQNTVL